MGVEPERIEREIPIMQTFGKRQYTHMEADPWAMRKKPREDAADRPASSRSRVSAYLVALVMVGVVAVAGFEFLVLA